MRDCKYGTIIDEFEVACSNFTDLVHSGTLPVSICDLCPFISPRGGSDYFSATESLLTHKQRIGEYTSNPQPCGGCADTKHRLLLDKELDEPTLQFVWPYWHGGAKGDEIRFSVRSVETFFQGRARCLIVGDRPPWYTGEHLPHRRVSRRTPNRGFRDMLSKVLVMATRDEIDSEFVWMMDDVYFLRPFTLDDMRTPRANLWRPSERNGWQKRKTLSMAALASRGMTQHDYATHLPHHVEQSKLATLFDEFDLRNTTLLWEVLYGNTYRENPIGTDPFFRRIVKQRSVAALRLLTTHAKVLNHTSGVWGPDMRSFLLTLMPDPTASELSDQSAVPTFRTTRRQKRVVKRRQHMEAT
jgi:hypothetical protein